MAQAGDEVRRDGHAVRRSAGELRDHHGHRIDLDWMTTGGDGFAVTDWILFVDGRRFYLGQESIFVRQVLEQDFAAFIAAAYDRAGITEDDDYEDGLLKASLAVGVVEGLCRSWAAEGRDFLTAVPELGEWALAAEAVSEDG